MTRDPELDIMYLFHPYAFDGVFFYLFHFVSVLMVPCHICNWRNVRCNASD